MIPFYKMIIVLCLFLLPLDSFSQEPMNVSFDKDKMDLLFKTIDENDKAMGSVSIFQNGKEVYQRSFGYADIANRIPATTETVYRIGSISKTFTAAIIMQLIEENKLSLDTRLYEYFPEIPNAKEITVEQLLRHRSGLFNLTSAEDYFKWMEEPTTQAELIQKFVSYGTNFLPDERHEYSNTNYVLLSFIAEIIDGKAFPKILKQRITKPLKLKNTYFGSEINTSQNEALSYTNVKSWQLSTETDMSVPMGAGAVASTPRDVNIFYNSLFEGDVVSDNSLSQMTKMVEGYGMGIFQIQLQEKITYAHDGGIDGFSSFVIYFPDDKVSVAVTLNALNMKDSDLLLGVLSIFLGAEYQLPEFKPAFELSSEELDIYLGTYSNPDSPFKEITITKNDNVLMAQPSGQTPVALEALNQDKFKYDPYGVEINFLPNEKKLVFKMGGDEFILTKEE